MLGALTFVSTLMQAGIPVDKNASIPGTGKNGGVTQGDVRKFATLIAEAPALADPPVVPGPTTTGDNAGPVTLDDCRTALKALNDAKGMPACIKVLTKVDAPNISAVSADKFGTFLELCQEEMA